MEAKEHDTQKGHGVHLCLGLVGGGLRPRKRKYMAYVVQEQRPLVKGEKRCPVRRLCAGSSRARRPTHDSPSGWNDEKCPTSAAAHVFDLELNRTCDPACRSITRSRRRVSRVLACPKALLRRHHIIHGRRYMDAGTWTQVLRRKTPLQTRLHFTMRFVRRAVSFEPVLVSEQKLLRRNCLLLSLFTRLYVQR